MSSALWHGWILASGFVFDEAVLGRAMLLERLLATWSDEARLLRRGTRWYLLGVRPRRVDSRAALGAPLVAAAGRWLMGPVPEALLMVSPRDAVLELVGGEVRVVDLAMLARAHPSELMELELPTVIEAEVLSAPPQQQLQLARHPEPGLDAVFAPMLASLGGPRDPPPAGRWWARSRPWLAAVRDRLGMGGWASAPTRISGRSLAGRFAGLLTWRFAGFAPWLVSGGLTWLLTGSFTGLLGWLFVWFLMVRSPGLIPTVISAPAASRAPGRPQRPGWLALLVARLGRERRRLAQQAYLEDLRRRFAEGDLAEALRRAIALSDRVYGDGVATGQVPSRRDSLALLTQPTNAAPSMTMADAELAAMKKMYREAAESLIAQGRIDEAAYLLAKLLRDASAATALLEKHGQVELAARLATAEKLPAVDRVRLWLLAKRKDEAIRAARSSTDFGALVTALASRAPAAAEELRLTWGGFLAERHRYAEALAATAPLAVRPRDWEAWLGHALEAGGATAVTGLALDLGRHPERVSASRARLAELLDQDGRVPLAAAAAEALLVHAPQGPVHRDVWRRLMQHAGAGEQVEPRMLERLLKASGDEALAVDAVGPQSTRLASRAPVELLVPVVSQLPAIDVAPLPRGRRAVAHGSAGLSLVSAHGETLRHLLVKADALVVGPVGATVLVLSLDGLLTRAWKLDPVTFELTSWFQARLRCWASRYDGLAWAVGMKRALVVLDPAAPTPTEWWRIADLDCEELEAAGSSIVALATDPAVKQTFRLLFSAETSQQVCRVAPSRDAFSRGKEVVSWELTRTDDGAARLSWTRSSVVLPAGDWKAVPEEAGLVLVRWAAGVTEVWTVGWNALELRTLARLPGTSRVRCRALSPGRLLVCDEHGRVLELEAW